MSAGAMIALASTAIQDDALWGNFNVSKHAMSNGTTQDIYTYAPDVMTMFYESYKKLTPFAMETRPISYNGTANFGGTIVAVVVHEGDLMHDVMVELTLPQVTPVAGGSFRWIDDIGHHIFEKVTIKCGNADSASYTGLWSLLWSELTSTDTKSRKLNKMLGQQFVHPDDTTGETLQTYSQATKPETTLLIPLKFWFCENIAQALPFAAMARTDIRIEIKMKPLSELYVAGADQGHATYNALSIKSLNIWTNNILFSIQERAIFANAPLSYTVTRVTCCDAQSIVGLSVAPQLTLAHPAKGIYWVVQHAKMITNANADEKHLINQWSNFTTHLYKDGGIHCANPYGSKNPVVEGTVKFASGNRFEKRIGSIFSDYNVWKYHTGCPASPAINVYPMCTAPESIIPSGFNNLSGTQNVSLSMTLTYDDSLTDGVSTQTNARMYIFVLHMNFFDCSGMTGGFRYAS